jgi:hypothetical protein
MNNENLEETFAQIEQQLSPAFSKMFDVAATAESGGYLDVALRSKKNKDSVVIIRIGRKEIFFIKEGKMRRQYSAVNKMEQEHLIALAQQ